MENKYFKFVILSSVLAGALISLALNIVRYNRHFSASLTPFSGVCTPLPSTDAVFVINANDKTLEKFDPSGLTLLAKASIKARSSSLAVSPDGNYVYVTSFDASVSPGVAYLEKFKTTDLSFLARVNTRQRPLSMAVSPDGIYVYVLNSDSSPDFFGHLQKFNSSNLNLVTETSSDELPTTILVSPDGKYIYVSNQGATQPATLEKFDFSLSLIAKVNSGYSTSYSAISPDGKYIYVIYRGAEVTGGLSHMRKFNTADLSLIATAEIPLQPFSIAASPDGKYVYDSIIATNPDGSNKFYLEKHNASDLGLVKQVTLGDSTHSGNAYSVAVSLDSNYVYVPQGSNPYVLQKFNASDLSTIATASTDRGPSFVAVPFKIQRGVIRKVGDQELNFLIKAINDSSVDGLWYNLYPSGSSQSKTLYVGNTVGYTCTGKTASLVCIDSANQVTTFTETIQSPSPFGCPICLASNTNIDTPQGQLNVKSIKVGDMVWSQNKEGKKIAVPVLRISSTPVPKDHRVVYLVLVDGRHVWVSYHHPTINGLPVGQLQKGDIYDGTRVESAESIPYWDTKTYDILPKSDTGIYWANGIALKSTLGP